MGIRKIYHRCRGFFRRLRIGRDKLFALARKAQLLVRRRQRQGPRYHPHALRTYPNLLKGRRLRRRAEAWVSDLTYLHLRSGGFAYASLVMDAFTRKIIGCHVAPTLEAAGPLRAFSQAVRGARRRGEVLEGLLHHSDRGTQYCSRSYTEALRSRGIRISMSAAGSPHENGKMERAIGTLKREYLLSSIFTDLEAARQALEQAVRLYNTDRPHLALAYQTPHAVHEQPLQVAA